MDCTIPSHNVKVFSGWVVTLGKIGSSDLYLEFDPLQGLTLRTLNDAKSAYAKVTLDPAFFEVCTEPPSSHDGNKYMCRLSIRTLYSVLKPSRKGLQSLRIRSSNNDGNQLSLEFRLVGNYSIYHRLAVQSCDHSIPAAVVEKKGCSEILIAPKLLQSMVEPLKRSHQVALHISHQVISATSFHTHISSSSSTTNATPGSNFHFKSETTLSCEELQDFYYKDDRTALDNYTENDDDNEEHDNDMPPNVNEDVTLVFGLKELQSMLQFCNKGGRQDNSSTVILYFYWGGKPLIVETEGDAYAAELVLATLDYKLLMRANQNNHTNQMRTPSNHDNNHTIRQDIP